MTKRNQLIQDLQTALRDYKLKGTMGRLELLHCFLRQLWEIQKALDK